ncbi:MAG TPA: hypothetical protein IAB12_02515 [Candidatus Ornithospirochaeta avicola]|uniref:Uncharacterized protein n=1 Tax=Candidatus Ornithospirochaeta avicola TaxID=2840896 RepID=A0A9D1PU38_9SPIO|nr:hypothetical protein [Candidatus Ornithospirochaeta avicola]
MSKIFRSILYISLVFIITACAIDAPVLPDSTKVPNRMPSTPEEIIVINGKDELVITFDAVEGATGYKVELSSFSGYVTGPNAPVMQPDGDKVEIKIDSSEVDIDLNQVFMLRLYSFTDFESGYERLESYPTAPIYVAFKPTEDGIYFSSLFEKDSISLFFSCPTVFYEQEKLYDVTFTIDIVDSQDQSKNQKYVFSTYDKSEGVEEYVPYETFLKLPINEFVQNRSYDFTLTMAIKDGESYTKSFTQVISGEYEVDDIAEAEATQNGTDGIEISFTAPSWSGFTENPEDHTLFALERSVKGSNQWQMLADEISERKDNPAFEHTGSLAFRYFDSSVIPGLEYEYRLYNAAFIGELSDSPQIYKAPGYTSLEGSMYYPKNVDASVSASVDGLSADLEFKADLDEAKPEDLEWKIIEKIINLETGESTEESVAYSDRRTISKPSGIWQYEYTLALYKGEDLYYTVSEFKTDEDIILNSGSVTPLFSSLKASDNRIGEILVTWNEIGDGGYIYEYSVDGSSFTSVENLQNNGSFTIESNDGQEKEIRLRAKDTSDIWYEPDYSVKGRDFTLPADLDLSASDGESATAVRVEWKSSGHKTDGISYYVSDEDGNYHEIADFTLNTLTIDYSDASYEEREKERTYSIVAKNAEQNKETKSSSSDSGSVLSSVKNVSATKGSLVAQVEITWDAVPGAEKYKIYKYSADVSKAVEIGESEGTSFTDNAYDKDNNSYTVRAVKADVLSLLPESYGKVQNSLYDQEDSNKGYPFITDTVSDIKIKTLYSDGYFADYAEISFKVNYPGQSDFEITPTLKTEPVIISIKDLEPEEESNILTNEDGSVVFDKSTDTVTALVSDAGKINRDSLSITYTEIAPVLVSDSGEVESTGSKAISNTEYRRELNKYDIAYIYSTIASDVLSKANSAFGGDWTVAWSLSVVRYYTVPGTSTTVRRNLLLVEPDVSALKFNGDYSEKWNNVTIKSDGDIKLDAGDILNAVGAGDENSTTISFAPVNWDSLSIGYKTRSVKANSVSVNADGSGSLDIDGENLPMSEVAVEGRIKI